MTLTAAIDYPDYVKAFFHGTTEALEDRHTNRILVMKDGCVCRVIEGAHGAGAQLLHEFLYKHFSVSSISGADIRYKLTVKASELPVPETAWGDGIYLPPSPPPAPTHVSGRYYVHDGGKMLVSWSPVHAYPEVTAHWARYVKYKDRSINSQDWRWYTTPVEPTSESFSIFTAGTDKIEERHFAFQVQVVNAAGSSEWSETGFWSGNKTTKDAATVLSKLDVKPEHRG